MQSRAASGEADTIAGWLAYGAALNEGRGMFPGDREFGEWVAQSQLGIAADGTPIKLDNRAAAMWAAGNPEQFEEAKAAGNARTVRVSGFGTPTPPLLVPPAAGGTHGSHLLALLSVSEAAQNRVPLLLPPKNRVFSALSPKTTLPKFGS
jgi:hypothetical protein